MLLENIKKQIDKHDVISFDIFDTLLLRPYAKPADLFAHLGEINNSPVFADLRVAAERAARRANSGSEDISYEEIYEHINPVYLSFKELELELEWNTLRPNPEMLEAFNYAKQNGKRVIIASDMYLDKSFIEKILHKNGCADYEKLYLSSEIKKTKHSGNLYKHILDDQKIQPSQMLHIGDNKHADYKKALKNNISAILYPQVLAQFQKANPRIKAFLQKDNSIGASVLAGIFSIEWINSKTGGQDADYWKTLGFAYAGPTCYAYSRFIERESINLNIDKLLFIARDGYTIEKVFNLLNDKIKTEYIYAPRFLNLTCRLDIANRSKSQSRAIINFFKDKDSELNELLQDKNLKDTSPNDFIQKNIRIFEKNAKIEKDKYVSYLEDKIKDSAFVGIVDTITYAYSSQKLIEDVLEERDVFGFYWGTLSSPFEKFFKHTCFAKHEGREKTLWDINVFTRNWDFMEFLMTSPELPVKGIDENNQPMYSDNPSAFETARSKRYVRVSEGALDFAKKIAAVFNGADVFIAYQTSIIWANLFLEMPSKEDFRHLTKIWHSPDGEHAEYVPIFVCDTSFTNAVKSPIKYIKHIKKATWKTPTQQFLLAIIEGVKIKRTKSERQLIFLPHLPKRYMTLTLCLPGKNLKIILGSHLG